MMCHDWMPIDRKANNPSMIIFVGFNLNVISAFVPVKLSKDEGPSIFIKDIERMHSRCSADKPLDMIVTQPHLHRHEPLRLYCCFKFFYLHTCIILWLWTFKNDECQLAYNGTLPAISFKVQKNKACLTTGLDNIH